MKRNSQYWKIRKDLIGVYGEICWYCGVELDANTETHIDHIIPRCAGGSDDLTNLALSCGMCNRAKFSLDATIFLRWLGRIRTGKFQCRVLDKIKHELSDIEKDWLDKEF